MKTMILTSAFIFELIGNFIPMLFGDNDFFSGWSILGGLVGGLFGIWVGYKLAQRFL